MTQEIFIEEYKRIDPIIDKIAEAAWDLHMDVGQKYGKEEYGVHLEMVNERIISYGSEVIKETSDILPIIFGGYYHDSIEDARLTYNDVLEVARKFMTEEQAILAANIVYACTNEKGKTRAERANDKYYEGIRTTMYAPLVKACDRLANIDFSSKESDSSMLSVYKNEMRHFLDSVEDRTKEDQRFRVPQEIIKLLEAYL